MKSLLISLQMLSFIFIIIQRCLIKKKKRKVAKQTKISNVLHVSSIFVLSDSTMSMNYERNDT